MARRDQGQRVREDLGEPPVRTRAAITSSPSWVEAAIQICRPEVRPESSASSRRSAGERGRVELEVAGDQRERAPSGEALGVGLAPREAEVEAAPAARR